MARIIFAFIVILFSQSSFAGDSFPEPFGLKWGMSEAELTKLGFTHATDSEGLRILTSVSVPKAWSKGDTYVAITYKGKLVKVGVTSKDFTNDIYGSEGKEAYNQMKSLLTKKYGSPASHYETIGNKLYKDADEFYQCLAYTGCGGYLSMYEISGGTIAVQINGKNRGDGYLTITYESPAFLAAKKEINKGDLKSDEGAF